MASKSLGTLTLDLVARTAGFVQGMDKAQRESAKWRRSVEKDMKAVGKAVSVAAVAVVAGVTAIVKRQSSLIDQNAKMAQQLGTTYDSLANLNRAGELGGVGLDKITTAARQLDVNLGRAIQGVDLQAKAFARLGLSAQELADLPLDRRLATINAALRDNVQASERAAVAAEIFGARNATAIQQLNPETIAQAAKEVEIFGLNLSDVDAANVELANDAMSTFKMAADGATKQLTVQLAPILRAVGQLFLDSAEEAGGMGAAVESGVDKSVNALAFMIDAIDGVGRAFTIVTSGAAAAIAKMNLVFIDTSRGLFDLLSKAPGAAGRAASEYLSFLDEASNVAVSVVAANMKKLDAALKEPLKGAAFKQFVAEAKETGRIAAEIAVESRNAARMLGEGIDDAASTAAEAVEKQLTALQRAAAVWGMSSDEVKLYDLRLQGATESQLDQAKSLLETVDGYEKAKKQQDSYLRLVSDLRTVEERRTDTLREQLAVIEATNAATSEQQELQKRAIAAAFADAPSISLRSSGGGMLGELSFLKDSEKELEQWYSTQLEMLNQYRAERSDLSAQWDAQELELKRQHEEAMQRLELGRWNAVIGGVGQILGQMQAMQETDSKKGKERAKKMAIAQATINAYMAFTGALASAASIPVLGWIMAPIAAAAALAAGMQQVNAIKGQAHDGLMSVPSTGTYILEKGERVTTADTSAKLDATLARIQAGEMGDRKPSRRTVVNQNINVQGTVDNRTANQMAMAASRRQRIANARLG